MIIEDIFFVVTNPNYSVVWTCNNYSDDGRRYVHGRQSDYSFVNDNILIFYKTVDSGAVIALVLTKTNSIIEQYRTKNETGVLDLNKFQNYFERKQVTTAYVQQSQQKFG